MSERRVEVLEREVFPVSPREDGHIPPAPEDAVNTYEEFKSDWQ